MCTLVSHATASAALFVAGKQCGTQTCTWMRDRFPYRSFGMERWKVCKAMRATVCACYLNEGSISLAIIESHVNDDVNIFIHVYI